MGWICSPNDGNCILRFYSIADDLKILNEGIFDYLLALSPGVWTAMIIMFIGSFIIALILSVRASLLFDSTKN